MAQPMTALLEPDNQKLPACPDFCNGTCDTRFELDGSNHHSSGFSTVVIANGYRGKDLDLDVSASRTDENYQAGTPEVNLIPSRSGGGFAMSPAEARQLAALLLNAADDADPLPAGDMWTSPMLLHLGDELLTDDGWQKVTGLMLFDDSDEASVFTLERDAEDSDGWRLDVEDLVHIRRRVYGTCAVQFVEVAR